MKAGNAFRSPWFDYSITLLVVGMLAPSVLFAAEGPKLTDVLKYKPVQQGIEYQTPTPAEYADCKVEVEKNGKASGWVVLGPQGEVLRRFTDTNADNVVDQWKYYQYGIEVYRDIDSNFDNKVDQCRWLNTGGARWGIDNNADGKIDEWKLLSAQEASRVAVEALINNDLVALQQVMITPAEITKLGISNELSRQIQENITGAAAQMKKARTAAKGLDAKAKWMRFDATTPGIIPADEGKAREDLLVYENAMSIVEAGGQTMLIQIGELVSLGDVWKLTAVPQPLVGDSLQLASGVLMQPSITSLSNSESMAGIPEEVQKLLDALQKLDAASPSPSDSPEAIAQYNAKRADILEKLVEASASTEEKEQWLQQMIDGLAAAVQTGGYPPGLERLKALEVSLKNNSLSAYVSYRRILAEYSSRLKATTDDEGRQQVQSWWLDELEKFSKAHEDSVDAAEAMFQLALAQEFSGEVSEAQKWYETISKKHPTLTVAKRADGALRRLNSDGKPFLLEGSNLAGGKLSSAQLKGKVTLVIYWASWSKRCQEDLPLLKELYTEYRSSGFEILGVAIDQTPETLKPFLTQQKINWPQMYEPGGDESSTAMEYGIIMVPTMFLLNKDGTVHSRPSNVDDLQKLLPELLKK
ncbi:Thiol-disulfide oxidoreductase ResA [Polystyrenella longa]|uniref:Thiol-disulfide oxidoreductase ResA n=1 Tax=Polystyrenella longa TaxID=2528007 RepID=A0A518CHW7_9PLAN|nr:TlpA disulfide reductase family protein [Polystyrenella longa]QDU78819.1 Thiol-disulfide oxidoreductase ResA [Polystyrenella longa]